MQTSKNQNLWVWIRSNKLKRKISHLMRYLNYLPLIKTFIKMLNSIWTKKPNRILQYTCRRTSMLLFQTWKLYELRSFWTELLTTVYYNFVGSNHTTQKIYKIFISCYCTFHPLPYWLFFQYGNLSFFIYFIWILVWHKHLLFFIHYGWV